MHPDNRYKIKVQSPCVILFDVYRKGDFIRNFNGKIHYFSYHDAAKYIKESMLPSGVLSIEAR